MSKMTVWMNAVSFSGGSFQDMTRVATMDEKMWASLFMDNRLLLLHHLELLVATCLNTGRHWNCRMNQRCSC